jgi:predicted ATP-dependent endonuclease of OLD family
MARKAVIAEGPSETILLPRLFRESDNISYLDFQVAPGIATVSRENASLFEFEAAKEIYLLDGDSAGNANKKKLILGGIDPEKIIQLENEYSIEDYVEPDILLNAVNREFEKSGIQNVAFPKNTLPKSNRIGWIEKQCNKNGHQLPSKVRIAENITRNPSDQQIIDHNMKKLLLNTYRIIQRKLEK